MGMCSWLLACLPVIPSLVYVLPFLLASYPDKILLRSEIRDFLVTTAGNGQLATHPDYAEFPMKGTWAFSWSPMGFIDASNFQKLEFAGDDRMHFEVEMKDIFTSSGESDTLPVPITGPIMSRLVSGVGYKNRFDCPRGPVTDGYECFVHGTAFGIDFALDFMRFCGMHETIRYDAQGEFWIRDTWFLAPWTAISMPKSTDLAKPSHTYYLYKLADENGSLREKELDWFLSEKLASDQDIVHF